MAGVAGVRQLAPWAHGRLPPIGRQRTGLFHGAPRKTHESGVLGRLLFVTMDPHSLGRGGGQHRGRRTGTWPRGVILAEPPPRVADHIYDGDEAATETGKAEGRAEHLLKRFGCANDTMINKHPSQWRGGARSVRMNNSLLSPFNLQSNFVLRFSLSTVIQIWWYWFLIFSKINIYSFMTFFCM
jgi:hypothetical protein